MSAAILEFPAQEVDRAPFRFAARAPTPPRPIANARREYSFADVARLLALSGQERTQIGYLRDLAGMCGMPLPKNPRRYRGLIQSGPAMIGSRSRWCALEFDAWLDTLRTPPPGVAAPAPAAVAEPRPELAGPLRLDLRQRARQLAAAAR